MMTSMSLVLVIVTLTVFSVAKADETLIGNLCDKTAYPGICKDCIHSDAGYPSADAVGLSRITINCAIKSSKLFSDDMQDLWSKSTGNAVEKDVLYWCWMGGKSANNLFVEALSLLSADRTQYVFVKDKILNGNQCAKWCLDRYNSKLPGAPIPDLVATETAVVDQDAVVADRFLKYLMEGN